MADKRDMGNVQQAQIDKFLEREWVDVRSKDKEKDAVLLNEVKNAGTATNELFENLLREIGGDLTD